VFLLTLGGDAFAALDVFLDPTLFEAFGLLAGTGGPGL
jgi:hypothetical protein